MDLVPLVANALDVAIARVAETEYNRLSEGRSPEDIALSVDRAIASLLNLGRGISPEYNEWDALFYLTWYQPRQINLALALAWPFQKEPQPLHIIDFGCGSLAMPIAMAIAVAQSELSEREAYIEMHEIDPSDAMRTIGLRLQRVFSDVVQSDPTLSRSSLIMANERIQEHMGIWRSLDQYYRSDRSHEGWIYPSPNCWLVAIHAVYATNAAQLREDFITVREKSDPAYEVVTCHDVGYANAQLICRKDARDVQLLKNRFFFSGYLDHTTSWRRRLATSALPTSDMTRRLLSTRSVPWNPPQEDKCIMWHFSGVPA